jgi:hypothetical protein
MVTTRVRDWLKVRFASPRRGRDARRRCTVGLWLEPLEQRCVPATLTWNCDETFHFSTNWSDRFNWSPRAVPLGVGHTNPKR